jgi:hypothetical protein
VLELYGCLSSDPCLTIVKAEAGYSPLEPKGHLVFDEFGFNSGSAAGATWLRIRQ